jgi:hypothetical protein
MQKSEVDAFSRQIPAADISLLGYLVDNDDHPGLIQLASHIL